MDYTFKIAEHVFSTNIENLPSEVRNKAKEVLLDYLGVTLYGGQKPWSKMVLDYVRERKGTPQSTVIGTALKADCASAALANGSMAHGFEIDDTHDPSVSHPGAVVISAALALGEKENAVGKEVLTAIVHGYEVMARVGMAVGSSLIERGFHPTSSLGPFGAAAAAGKVLGLDREKQQNCLSLAGSFSSGLMEFSQDSAGNMVKRLHAGKAAENGIEAACLAQRGFTGPRKVLEGKYGFCRVFSETPEMEKLTKDLGEDYQIMHLSVKPYACCRLFHSLIDAVLEIKRKEGVSAELGEIEKITVYGPSIMITQHLVYRPASIMAAQYSLPYVAAVAVCRDPGDPNLFSEENLYNRELLEMASRVDAEIDMNLDRQFPKKFGSAVQVEFKDGRKCYQEMLDSRGTPSRPLSGEEMEAKFLALTDRILSTAAQKKVIEKVNGLEELEDITALVEETLA